MKKCYCMFVLLFICLLIFEDTSSALEINLDSKAILLEKQKTNVQFKKIIPEKSKINLYERELNYFTAQSTSPSTMEWGYLYGTTTKYERGKIRNTNDGGYVIAGYSGADVYVTKTDSSGNIVWSNTYSGNLSYHPTSVQETSDNGFIISGTVTGSGIFILNLDSNGNVVWSQVYNGTFIDIAAKEFLNGYAFICSYDCDSDSTDRELYLFVTDLNGNILWDKYFDDSTNINHNSVAIEIDELNGRIIIFSHGWYDFEDRILIYRVSSRGDILSKKVHNDIMSSYLCVIKTDDGGYALIGDAGDPSLLKLDNYFEISWLKSYSLPLADYISFDGIEQTADNGFILIGQCKYPYPNNERDIWMLKTYSNGSKEWENLYNIQFYDCANFVHQTYDGGYVVGGHTNQENLPTDIFLVKYK